ncbi:MAG: VOC family protein [Sulfitobacter sp.]
MQKLSSQLVTPGVILFTEHFDACVSFYKDKLGLPVWFEKEGLVCLKFGTSYLMVERGGMASATNKPVSSNPTMLRFNVNDVANAAQLLAEQGISVEIVTHDWGTTGTFSDPDVNLCSLKNADDPYFEE